MSYTRVNWKDCPETDTPITAENLNVMDAGIENLDEAISQLNVGLTETNANLEAKDNLKLATDSNSEIKFGIDADGNYGYIKAGADTVTPFKTSNGEPILVGTYSSNTTIDVSEYKPTSVSQFICSCTSSKSCSVGLWNMSATGANASYTPPSVSLNGDADYNCSQRHLYRLLWFIWCKYYQKLCEFAYQHLFHWIDLYIFNKLLSPSLTCKDSCVLEQDVITTWCGQWQRLKNRNYEKEYI